MRLKISTTVKIFISYAWESDEHKKWVLDLASRLKSDGLEVRLDQWDLVPGDQLPSYMERSVADSDFVLFVCTPAYKSRADNRQGGVGYEGDVITGEVYQTNNHRKFIPILRRGEWRDSAPIWAMGKVLIDFRETATFDHSYSVLVSSILGQFDQGPDRGEGPLLSNVTEEVWEGLASLKIEADALSVADLHRHHRLKLDGEEIADLADGGVFLMQTSPGNHRLSLRYEESYYRGHRIGWADRISECIFDIKLKHDENALTIRLSPGRSSALAIMNLFYAKNDEYYLRLNGKSLSVDRWR